MTLDAKALWQSLTSFRFDDPVHAVPFSARLRREQGWGAAHTSRVLEEYRRFLLLAATNDALMVPSEDVDQAWHLHMLDTRSYWDDLCGRIVGQPVHHTPSRGGAAEDTRHADAYEHTLRRYREVFGEAPPGDIWPSAHERFAGRYLRVDTRDAWVIRKRLLTHGGSVAGAIGLLAGCSKVAASVAGTAILVVGIFAFIIGAIVWAARQARVGDGKSTSSVSGCGGGGVGGCGCDGGGSGGCGGGGCGGGCGG